MSALVWGRAVPQSADPLTAAVANADWKQAEALARSALAKDRRNAAAWTYLGLAQDHLDKKQQALGDFAEAVRLDSNATFAHNNYGASLEANGKQAQAAEEYRRSLSLDHNQPAALVNLARLRIASGSSAGRDEARQLLQAAWQLAPDVELARSLLLLAPCASLATPTTTITLDLDAYSWMIATQPEAVPEAEQSQVGHALLGCGLVEDARAYYDALLAAEPSNQEAALGKAQAQLAAAHPNDAGRTLEGAIAGGMEVAPLYALLAQVYAQTGHMDHAVPAMKHALELSPADELLQFRYGMLLLDAHAPKAAELRMRQAVERQPASWRLWFVLGLAQFDQTNPATAQASFDRAISLNPKSAPALAYRGLAALDQQQYAEAELWYRKAIAADPGAADLHCLLAEALERQHPGQTTKVRAELDKAVEIDPKLATAHLALGRLDLDGGKPADAVQELQTALRLDPGERQAHFYLARAYRQVHDTEHAVAESHLFSEQQTAAEADDRAAIQNAVRQLANTAF